MVMEVPGKRRRGRPKRRRLDNMKNDLSERIVRGGSPTPSSMEASHTNHRPHIKVGKDAEEEDMEIFRMALYKVNLPRHGIGLVSVWTKSSPPVTHIIGCTFEGVSNSSLSRHEISTRYLTSLAYTWAYHTGNAPVTPNARCHCGACTT